MLKKINSILNMLMAGCVGAFIGVLIYRYVDHKKNPDLYCIGSAPWYAGICTSAIALVVVLTICIIAKIITGKKASKYP